MSDESAFRRIDEDERIYAPEQLPTEERIGYVRNPRTAAM